MESGTFKGKFGNLMWPSGTLMFTFKPLFFFFFFNKKPFRPSVVLSRLFVSVSVAERLAGSLQDRWSSSLL